MTDERYKEFGYEITTDPRFMDEQNAMTPELRNELEPLYIKIMEGKGGKKTIDRILKLIEKYPKNPQLKNYLSEAYKENGNIQKAREVNRWIIAEHPDYLFGKLNLAAEYFENEAGLLNILLSDVFTNFLDSLGTCWNVFDSKLGVTTKRLLNLVTKKLHEDYLLDFKDDLNKYLRILHSRSNHIDLIFNLPDKI